MRETGSVQFGDVFTGAETNKLCRERTVRVGDVQSCFSYDSYGTPVRTFKLDAALLRVVPERLCHRLLLPAHYPVLTGHPGRARIQYTLRREFQCPRMASNLFSSLRNCQKCTWFRRTHFKHQRLTKLFPASGLLEFYAVDLLGWLKRTRKEMLSFGSEQTGSSE